MVNIKNRLLLGSSSVFNKALAAAMVIFSQFSITTTLLPFCAAEWFIKSLMARMSSTPMLWPSTWVMRLSGCVPARLREQLLHCPHGAKILFGAAVCWVIFWHNKALASLSLKANLPTPTGPQNNWA